MIRGALLVALAAASWRQDPVPHAVFAGEAVEILSGPATDEIAERLRAHVERAPARGQQMLQELLRQAAEQGPDTWAMSAAARLAAALDATTGTTVAAGDVERYRGLDDAARARRLEADVAFSGATIAANAEDTRLAEERAQESLAIALELEDTYLESRSRRLLGRLVSERGEFDLARGELEASVAIDRSRAASGDLALGLRWLGDLEVRAGRPASALERFHESGEAARAAREPSPLDHRFVGELYAWFGRHAEARPHLELALDQASARQDAGARSDVLLATGTLESASGRYGEALQRLTAARDAADGPARERAALVAIAGVQSEIGEVVDALATLARALELVPRDQPLERARVLRNIGLARLDTGVVAFAAEALDESHAIFVEEGDAAGAFDVQMLQARAASMLRLPPARALWQECALYYESSRRLFPAALARIGLGEAWEQAGDHARARVEFDRAMAHLVGVVAPEVSWRARFGLGRAAEASGSTAEALALYRAALADVETIRADLGAPGSGTYFLEGKLELYHRTARMLARGGDLEEAFRWTEAAKSRALRDRFAVRAGGSRDLEAAESAEGTLRALELSYHAALAAGVDDTTREAFEGSLDGARNRIAGLRATRGTERGLSLSGLARPASLAEVRSRLAADAALVEYLVDDDLSAWVLRADGARFVELPASGLAIREWLSLLHAPVERLRECQTDVHNLSFEVDAARALYDALVLPLEAELAGAKTVWIVPDGDLWRAPFAAFVKSVERRRADPNEVYAYLRGCRFWIEDVELAVLPSASLLPRRNATGARPDGLVVVADPDPLPPGATPLPAARREAQAVARRATPGAVLAGAEANEPNVRERMPRAAWLHFAVHGVLDPDRPSSSRLALGPSGSDDGWFHAHEIEELELMCDHVVLSACETAGDTLGGEGLLGLPRAFLVAGADSCLTSTWLVDDAASADFFTEYYAALDAGADEIAALREAQLAFAREGGRPGIAYAHPFFWAGYLHVGASRGDD